MTDRVSANETRDWIRPPRVLIVQRIIPHYRVPLFRTLCSSEKMCVTVAYGLRSHSASLESVINPTGVSVVLLQNLLLGAGTHLTYQRGLLPLLRKSDFDVVIAEFDVHILSNLTACFWTKRSNVGFIWWGHGISPHARPLSRHIRLWWSRWADAMIFYDAERAGRFVSWGVPARKVFVAWNSIDIEEIAPLVQDWSSVHRNRVLCIGRLIPEKRVDLLVKGFHKARPHLPSDTRLTIIGDGPERQKLDALVHELNLQRCVDLVGALHSQEQLAPYFNSSVVSVSPGYIGLSAIHSLAYGIPMLVADNEPHSPEIVAIQDGVNARFFAMGSAGSLADSLVQLVTDTQLLPEMSAAARRAVQERFSIAGMVEAFEAAVLSVKRGSWVNECSSA